MLNQTNHASILNKFSLNVNSLLKYKISKFEGNVTVE